MRTKDFENGAVPTIMESIQSGETTPEIQLIFQTQLLVGILMALNDMLTVMTRPPKQFINTYSLPIRD